MSSGTPGEWGPAPGHMQRRTGSRGSSRASPASRRRGWGPGGSSGGRSKVLERQQQKPQVWAAGPRAVGRLPLGPLWPGLPESWVQSTRHQPWVLAPVWPVLLLLSLLSLEGDAGLQPASWAVGGRPWPGLRTFGAGVSCLGRERPCMRRVWLQGQGCYSWAQYTLNLAAPH